MHSGTHHAVIAEEPVLFSLISMYKYTILSLVRCFHSHASRFGRTCDKTQRAAEENCLRQT